MPDAEFLDHLVAKYGKLGLKFMIRLSNEEHAQFLRLWTKVRPEASALSREISPDFLHWAAVCIRTKLAEQIRKELLR